MEKFSYNIQMSYDVSDAEKEQAEKAIIAFNYTLKTLKAAIDHLNIIYIPFKDHPDISPDQLIKFRAALRRFRDKSIENFTSFKMIAFKCITLMQLFASDTQTVKLMKSFINAIDDIEKQVNEFSDLFSNLESKTFVQEVISKIENIQAECEELEEIIDDRIRTHLESNILGKSWMNAVSDQLDMKVEKKTPILIDLFNERQNELNRYNKK